MIRKTIPGVCLCLAFVAFACASLAAQVPQIVLTQRSPNIQPANGPEAGLTKIYSNLGSKTDAYDDGISYQISGPSNPLFGKGYLAMPFTPAQNSTVKEVLIALGYLGGGLNGGTIGLVTDENGAPGTTPLRTWTASNFPHEGTCCPLVELKDAAGIPLEGGTQYWIVAGLSPGTEEGQYQWNFVWNDATGPLAFLNGNTDYEWLPYTDNLAAFGVYGTTP
jgi:hypothetical protein